MESGGRRVLILADDLGGGTGNHVLSMIRHWDPALWRVEAACAERASARVATDIPMHVPPRPARLNRYPLAQIRRLLQLRTLVLEYEPAIVHAYFFWSILYGRLLKRLGAIRSLVENREDHGFNWGRHEYLLLRATRSLPDRVICVSESVRNFVLKKEGLRSDRVLVIENGVEAPETVDDSDRGLRRALGFRDEDLVVGMVANMNRPIKGVSYFLDAMPAILRAVPSARFLIVGRGQAEGALREKARALGIEAQVVFAGFRSDIGRLYRAMDVSVLTSLSEGLSMTLLESMAHALPVVVTRVGGNPEVVVEGGTGFLVPPKNPAAFAGRVALLLQDPDLRRRMGRAGRARVEDRFRLRETSERYLGVYESLIEEAPRRSGPRDGPDKARR
jgi:glycosyltransferase involved in cell wall biosynthesis